MKLQTKLFLSLFVLLCGYAIIIFFIPTFVVTQDIAKVGSEIHDVIINKERQLLRDQEVLVEDVFQDIRTNLNALLFFVLESKDISQQLVEFKKNELQPVWKAATHIVTHFPSIGFLQVSSEKSEQAVILKPSEADVYRAKTVKTPEGAIVLNVHNALEEKGIFLGVKLPQKFQTNLDATYYAMLDWEMADKQEERMVSQLKAAQERLQQQSEQFDVGQIFSAPANQANAAFDWLNKMKMITLLTSLVIEGVEIEEGSIWTPVGLAKVSVDNQADVIFSEELLGTKAITPPGKYYEEHAPRGNAPPIGEGNFYIYDENLKHIYLANTLDLNGTFLTLGVPIDKIAKEFAVWSNKPVLITVGDELWMGFDGNGELFNPNELEKFAREGMIEKGTGVINYQNISFFFSNIAEFEGGRLGIYELAEINGQNSVAALSLAVAKNLSWKISFQIFVISLILIAAILFVISRIVLRVVIRPIIHLAGNTELVVAGQYDAIKWPNMGKRKDEIASLTHSFEQMVVGLREKENIRSVLDKVVSKEVAAEILKSQIHLGGEERRVSVLFSDIRGFTNMTERMTPRQTIEILNSCMTRITHVIEGEGGVIDKFVGDEVMAIYGAPTVCADHALRAVSAGVLTMRALKIWNDERAARGEERIEMGIGINTGEVVAGNMGAVDRLNYTVLGKNVNVAARLCSIAKGNQLIISELTLNEPGVKESFYVELLPSVMLKGFSEPFRIYSVIDFKWETG